MKTKKIRTKRSLDIPEVIARALVKEKYMSKPAADEVAFHLTDWLDDLNKFVEFLSRPSRYQSPQVCDIVFRMVTHVPHHINAAYRIMMDEPVTDSFDLGTVKGTGRAKRKGGEPLDVSRYIVKRRSASSKSASRK